MTDWTRDDLPTEFDDSRRPGLKWHPSPELMSDLAAWLNEHYPKPVHPMDPEATRLRRERDEVRGEVQRLFDQCRARYRERDEAKRERDAAVARADDLGKRLAKVMSDYQDVEDERDEWKARAEAAERSRGWFRDRAEAAEARTAPAVTKADIEECVYGSRRAGRECDKQGFVPVHVQEAVERLCDLLGIEAEQAVDPVEELAGQIETAAREAIRKVCVLTGAVAPGLDDGVVNEMLDITSESRRLAAHVLGQEATR